MLAGVVVWSVGPRGHSSRSKQGGVRGVTVGWEASEESHSGMFQLTGHVLLHCSAASVIHMYAHKACWEQTSDIQCLESLCQTERVEMVMGGAKHKIMYGEQEQRVHIWFVWKDKNFSLKRGPQDIYLL